jgi:O-antigen/teichoic acid export membrane protein
MRFRGHKFINRLRDSKAARNAAASYVAFASTTITGLISIPLAVHFLTKQELGLWAVISALGGYLTFMELGIGFATGRKMADGIVAKDKLEIYRWWTLSRVVLSVQGLIVILIGLALMPLFMSVIAADFPDKKQALFLFTGIVLVQGIKLPFQGAEGILTAQERFHWVQLRQAILFWVELIVFAALVVNGHGLYSVFWSKIAMLVVEWLLNWAMLSRSDPKLGWNSSGLRWDRLKSLFGFSLNISAMGFVDGLIRSLPIMILGKVGELAAIPVYTISIKISTVMMSLGQRNYQSFYPALQRMFIQGEREKFFSKYADVGLLTVATGLGISGIILCMNRTAVELLAKPEFYAGPVATAWFAVATITMPVCGLLQTPLLVAGKMGKSGIVAVSRAIVAVGLCILAFRQYGIAGLAAVMALLPLVMGAYAYFRGAKEVGCQPAELAGSIALWTFVSMTLVISGGILIHLVPATPLLTWVILGKPVSIPSWLELIVGGLITTAALALFLRSLNRLRKTGHSKTTDSDVSMRQTIRADAAP